MKLSNNPTAKNLRRISARSRLRYRAEYTPKQEEEMATLDKRIMPPEVARASRSKIYRGVK